MFSYQCFEVSNTAVHSFYIQVAQILNFLLRVMFGAVLSVVII